MAEIDYKSLHLSWIRQNPQFVTKHHQTFASEPYYDLMATTYARSYCNQECARRFFAADMRWKKTADELIKNMTKEAHKDDPLAPIFVTIGFNHQTWDIPGCVKVIENIVQLGWVGSIHAVFELHRENGLHPHVHMLITPNVPITKSKTIEKIWAAKGIKKVCLKKSFIDYKIAADYHHKYILGDKTEAKTQYVLADVEWRSKNGIPQYFKK